MCVSVCSLFVRWLRAPVFVSVLINFDCKGEWRAFVEQKQQV